MDSFSELFSMDDAYSIEEIESIARSKDLVITYALDELIPQLTIATHEDGETVWQFEAYGNEVFHLVFEDLDYAEPIAAGSGNA